MGYATNGYYVITGSNEVYICIQQGKNSQGVAVASVVEPTGNATTPFTTSDGYTWKYMYTLSNANNTKFSTSDFVPVDVNTSIVSAASNGSIEIIQITNAGSSYTGFATGFIQQVISNTVFKLEILSILYVLKLPVPKITSNPLSRLA